MLHVTYAAESAIIETLPGQLLGPDSGPQGHQERQRVLGLPPIVE